MLLHRLVLGIGGMTKQELVQRMSSTEFSDWVEFWRREPWGPIRDNMHAGVIASTIANRMRGRNAKATTMQDFMLVTPEQDAEQKQSKILGLFQALAARSKK